MTTRSALRPQSADYAHLEPLLDTEREPYMQQSESIISFNLIIRPHFAHREDVLILGEGYMRHEAANEAELARVQEQLRRLRQD